MRQPICPLCGRVVRSKGLFTGGAFFHLGCYFLEVKCLHCGRKVPRGKFFTLQKCPECGAPVYIESKIKPSWRH